MTYLLDVNVLIALIDPDHVSHDVAQEWFDDAGAASWATCPLTEAGVLRIVGHPRYANSPGSPAAVVPFLARLKSLSGHVFWKADLSLFDDQYIDASQITTSAQVTDSYLLALAAKNNGQLATLDRRLATRAVRRGQPALCVIPTTPK